MAFPIYIKDNTPGVIWTVDIDADTTVGDIKNLLFAEIGYRPEEQKLIFKGEQLEDNRLLIEYEYLLAESTLHLVIRLHGGIPPPPPTENIANQLRKNVEARRAEAHAALEGRFPRFQDESRAKAKTLRNRAKAMEAQWKPRSLNKLRKKRILDELKALPGGTNYLNAQTRAQIQGFREGGSRRKRNTRKRNTRKRNTRKGKTV